MKKAAEYGAVEIWMNERVRRACASSCADFLYGFREVYLLTQLYACVQSFRAKRKGRGLKNIVLFGVLKARIHCMISCKARNSLTM